MDQVQNSMLQMVQAMTVQSQQTNRDSGSRDEFRRLVDQQQKNSQNSTAKSSESPKGESPQEGEDLEVQEDPKLQEQMMLAAAAMLQNPVVTQAQDPVEKTEAVVEAGGAVVESTVVQEEALPQTQTSLAEGELSKVSPDGTMKVREGFAEEETVEEPAAAPAEKAETVVEKVEITRSQKTETEDEKQETPEDAGETAVFQELEAVPVKVGEAPAAEKTQEARPVEVQIGEKLTEALEKGETRVEIQLTPENLGKVTIEVTQRQDGSIQVTLHAENHQTRSLLERDITGLQSALARNSQQEVRVEVRHQEPQQRNFYEEQQGREQRNPHQRQREERRSKESTEDFLHQLRLGLIPEGE